MEKLIVCKNVSINYDAQKAVKDVSFSVCNGDYLSIVGENGSGKSTLIKAILGLIKPSSGFIDFKNIEQTEIGYLPQQTVVQRDFPSSVFEVVLSGCLNQKGLRPFFLNDDKIRARENIKLLGIEKLSKKSYRDLSGGQQQRVLLARALCATKKLILLDEPVSGLDPVVTSELYQVIEKLNKDHGVTIIIVSHDIISTIKYSNIILHMDKSCKFYGTVEEYKKTSSFLRMIGDERND